MRSNKKISIFILMILILTTAVSAFDTLSVSEVNFKSNDPELNGKAFLLAGVENKRSDSVLFSIKDVVESELPDEQRLKQDGKISSSIEKYEIGYPLINENYPTYKANIVGERKYLPFGVDYDSWCAGLSSSDVWFWKVPVPKFTLPTAYCVEFTKTGEIGRISTSYQIEFEDKITVELNDGSKEVMILSEQNKVDKNIYVIARLVGTLGSFQGVPQPATTVGVVWKTSNNKWIIAKKSELESYQEYTNNDHNLGKIKKDCINDAELLGRANVEKCVNNFNQNTYIRDSGYSEYDTRIDNSRKNGRLTLINTPIYEYPVFTLKIDADWIGIFLPVGKPVIVSSDSDCFQEGSSGKINMKIKNDADVKASFDIGITCGSDFKALSNNAVEFSKGQTKSFEFFLTGQTESSTEATCTITVKDSSNPSVKDSTTQKVCVVDANTCADRGKKRCNGNVIQECKREGSVNVWKNIASCSECLYDNGKPYCFEEGKEDNNEGTGGQCTPTVAFGNVVIIPSFDVKEANFVQKFFGVKTVSCFGTTALIGLLVSIAGAFTVFLLLKKWMKNNNFNETSAVALSLISALLVYVGLLNLFWKFFIVGLVVGFIWFGVWIAITIARITR